MQTAGGQTHLSFSLILLLLLQNIFRLTQIMRQYGSSWVRFSFYAKISTEWRIFWVMLWTLLKKIVTNQSVTTKQSVKKQRELVTMKSSFQTKLKTLFTIFCNELERKTKKKIRTFLFVVYLFHSILYYCFYVLTRCQKPIRTFVLSSERKRL